MVKCTAPTAMLGAVFFVFERCFAPFFFCHELSRTISPKVMHEHSYGEPKKFYTAYL